MPSSARQFFGYGVGPGYHADMLLGKAYKTRTAARRVKRLPAPLSPTMAPPIHQEFGDMSIIGYGY